MPLSPSSPIETGETTKADILDLLNDESDIKETLPLEDEKEVPPAKEKEEPKEEGKEKEIELAEEGEEETDEYKEDEDLDIIAPARRKEILKKYPNLFKEFPHLEKAYYRDQVYNELFSTPEEAKEVAQVAKTFETFQNQVVGKGDTTQVLRAVKEYNPDAFAKLVDGYLPTLRQVDDRAFFHVVGNVIKSTAGAMAQEASTTQNPALLDAARLMYQFVMGTTNYTAPTTFGKPEKPEENEQLTQLNNERLQLFQERIDTTQSDLQSRVDSVLKNTIDQNMDPRGSMTQYVKRVAVQEALDDVQSQIDTDPSFRRLLDRLWERAADEKFSKTSVERIRSAYLSKAKTLLPAAIKKSRNEALRGLGKRVREDNEEPEVTPRKRESASPQTFRGSTKDNPSKGKSTLAFLNED